MSIPADDSLLERARQGDVAAFEALVESTRDRVYGVAFRILRNEAEAAEIAQETFLSAWQSLDSVKTDFGHWVHRIAANRALMRIRHRKAAPIETHVEPVQFSPRGGLAESVADWGPDAEGEAITHELRTAIQQATDSLPESHRQIFILHDIDGLDYQQLSEMLGESIPALKSRLHRARLSMRAAIDRFYALPRTNSKP